MPTTYFQSDLHREYCRPFHLSNIILIFSSTLQSAVMFSVIVLLKHPTFFFVRSFQQTLASNCTRSVEFYLCMCVITISSFVVVTLYAPLPLPSRQSNLDISFCSFLFFNECIRFPHILCSHFTYHSRPFHVITFLSRFRNFALFLIFKS